MGTAYLSARKLIIAGAFTFAATIPSMAPVVFAPADLSAQQSGCSNGEEGDLFTGSCVPYLVPNTHATSNNMCPAGVSGSECGGPTGQVGPAPHMPAPMPPSQEEQDLADVVTPGY
jgi:hypothetical protein